MRKLGRWGRAMTLVALFAGMSAAGVKYVAVVETGIDERSGASSMLNAAEVSLITTELRRVAVENLPRDKYNIMTSETVQSMGGAVLEECAEENCVITLGSRIGADYIVRGIISKLGARLTLSVEMYETENGTLVASLAPMRSENVEGLVDNIVGACGEMYRKFAGTQMQITKQQKKTQVDAKTQSTENHTANTYNDDSLESQYKERSPTTTQILQSVYKDSLRNQYDDFTIGQRCGTWGLNFMIPGMGSFIVMRDYVGGSVLLGTEITGILLILNANAIDDDNPDAAFVSGWTGIGLLVGGQIFNLVRSITYHKPNPKSSAHATNFKPYDGLKLAIVPTASGDYKVFARYDYSF